MKAVLLLVYLVFVVFINFSYPLPVYAGFYEDLTKDYCTNVKTSETQNVFYQNKQFSFPLKFDASSSQFPSDLDKAGFTVKEFAITNKSTGETTTFSPNVSFNMSNFVGGTFTPTFTTPQNVATFVEQGISKSGGQASFDFKITKWETYGTNELVDPAKPPALRTPQTCSAFLVKTASIQSQNPDPLPLPPPGSPGDTGEKTKAAGIPCDPVSGVPTANGSGVFTAIGCVPTQPTEFIQGTIRYVIGFAGGVALLIMAIGAFQMITSAGNPESLKAGQERFTAAIIGLLFIIFAVALLRIIGVSILDIPGFPGA